MKRILLPIDETTRSLLSLSQVKKMFSPEEAEIVLLMVDEKLDYTASKEMNDNAYNNLEQKLELLASALEGYNVIKRAEVGKAGQRIVKCARDLGVDLIMMTKSSRDDMKYNLGKTTEYVVTHASCNVTVVTEQTQTRNEYRGLVYKRAEAVVNLRGQLSLKQSECLIPSVSTDCIYHIEVKRGKVRFIHRSYNTLTRSWDIAPLSGDEETFDIMAGQSVDIKVKAHSVDGKADRIRIVNRNMKTEAVFSYKITADNTDNTEAR